LDRRRKPRGPFFERNIWTAEAWSGGTQAHQSSISDADPFMPYSQEGCHDYGTDGSSRHGYDFVAPLDPQGHIDPVLWKKYRDYCRIRRFWDGEDDEIGHPVHEPGGADRARWVFDYSEDEDGVDEAGYRFEAHAFWPCEYVSINGQDRKLHTFRVVTVDPVVLSMALIKSFEPKMKV
jgi:hypothetical protein